MRYGKGQLHRNAGRTDETTLRDANFTGARRQWIGPIPDPPLNRRGSHAAHDRRLVYNGGDRHGLNNIAARAPDAHASSPRRDEQVNCPEALRPPAKGDTSGALPLSGSQRLDAFTLMFAEPAARAEATALGCPPPGPVIGVPHGKSAALASWRGEQTTPTARYDQADRRRKPAMIARRDRAAGAGTDGPSAIARARRRGLEGSHFVMEMRAGCADHRYRQLPVRGSTGPLHVGPGCSTPIRSHHSPRPDPQRADFGADGSRRQDHRREWPKLWQRLPRKPCSLRWAC